MPEISRFFGIIITMYFNGHNPPHFHVRYNEHKAEIGIETLSLLAGKLPPHEYGVGHGVGEHSSRGINGRLGISSSASYVK
jgi:hypothetical protein